MEEELGMQKKIESPYIDSGKIASAAAILLICQVVLGSVSLMFYLVNRPDFRAYMQSDPFFLIFVYFQLSMAVTLWMKKRGLILTLYWQVMWVFCF